MDVGMSDARKALADLDEEIVLLDGFDAAIIGFAERAGQPILPVYDREKCISVLMERDGMDREDAEAFFEEQVVEAWFGDRTPLVFSPLGAP